MLITIKDIIEKRRARWEERHDLEYDRELVRASVCKILSEKHLQEELLARPYLLIEVAFYIVDKERKTVPFFFNDVQKDFIKQLEARGGSGVFFVLKGRQQGFTSLITAIQLSFAILKKNFAGFTMADRADNTAAIFNDKARAVYDRLPSELKPSEKFNSRNELYFDRLGSSWRVATATANVGRSRTLNFVHFSEVAFYECDLASLQAGIGEAIAAGAIVVYETTANGFNQAKDLWDSGVCINLFYEWWRTPEYRSTEYKFLETDDAWLIERIELLYKLGCDREQVTWYAKKYASYIDKNTIRQEYPITPEEAFISSGDCVFDKEKLYNRIAECAKLSPPRRGYFTYKKEAFPIRASDGTVADVEWRISDIEFVDAADGYIFIHEEPRMKLDRFGQVSHRAPYSLGGDTAGSGEDYFTAKVVSCMDDRTAATLHRQRIDEDLYGEQLYCLGKYYNDALIGVEINYSKIPTRVLQKFNYPNLYVREKLTGISDVPVLDYGFETTSKTRPIIIGELVALMRQDPSVECDIATLKEMTTFIRREHGRMEADEGCHDDLVMALAIAHFIKRNQPTDWLESRGSSDTFISDNFKLDGYSSAQDGGNSGFMSWEEL